MELFTDEVIKKYLLLKKTIKLIETGEWRKNFEICIMPIEQIETMRAIVKELEEYGIDIFVKLRNESTN